VTSKRDKLNLTILLGLVGSSLTMLSQPGEVTLFLIYLEPEKGIKTQVRERKQQRLLVAEESKKGTVS
jgi:hypothetical protein